MLLAGGGPGLAVHSDARTWGRRDSGAAVGATPRRIGFGPRFGAWLIDTITCFIGSVGLFVLAALLTAIFGTDFSGLATLLTLVLPYGYFFYFWATSGQTWGMRAVKIRVARVDGQPMTAGTAGIRLLGYIISSWAFGLGLLWVLWDAQRQGWHDKMAGTVVVQAA